MNRIVSQLLTTHATLSTRGTYFICLFPCPTLIALLILPKSHAPLRIGFAWGFVLDLLSRVEFCLRSLFSIFVFLTFFSFGGKMGKFFLHFCLFLMLQISQFSPFSRNSRFG